MVKSLVERLNELAKDTGHTEKEVLQNYELNYNYVLQSFPPSKLEVYQEVSYIRTKRTLRMNAKPGSDYIRNKRLSE